MTTHAALIAEKLQGAHERRQRNGREDKDMGKDIWDDVTVTPETVRLFAEAVALELGANRIGEQENDTRVAELERQLNEQGAHFDASRVEYREEIAELEQRVANMVERALAAERLLADARADAVGYVSAAEQLEHELRKARAELEAARATVAELNHATEIIVQDAYVPREVPWSDVAAGMMTISAQGEAWMVQDRVGTQVFLRKGEESFPKDPKPGETVRVLVPYVTTEQAESLVKTELGGTEVGA